MCRKNDKNSRCSTVRKNHKNQKNAETIHLLQKTTKIYTLTKKVQPMQTKTNNEANNMAKQVRVYGTLQKTIKYTQRYWHTRNDGIKQRYVHKITKAYTRKVEKQFSSIGDLKEQIGEWIDEQQEFGTGGYEWIEKDDDS